MGLNPSGGQGRNSVGDIKVLHSRFGQGWVLGGSSSLLECSDLSKKVCPAAIFIAAIAHLEVRPVKEYTEFHTVSGVDIMLSKVEDSKFMESDNLGVLPAKRCDRCLGCSDCSN